ncbi:MAG TPA: hypothetical protein VG347_05760, partial [Verrucomicrobiae bacterium]|nr:hypothetical protein [Verrucomicrobiae bacterium]
TTFSMDVAAMDELDDIEPRMMKFVRGRLAAGELRFVFKTGTQRVHGRGMNKAWKDGSQGVFVLTCPECRRRHNPEEEFPGIIRMKKEEFRMKKLGPPKGGTPNLKHADSEIGAPVAGGGARGGPSRTGMRPTYPKLTWAGDFVLEGGERAGDGRGEAGAQVSDTLKRHKCRAPGVLADGGRAEAHPMAFAHEPGNEYYLGCVECGAELDRTKPVAEHRRRELLAQRKWSFRISQLSIGAIDLGQIVTRFQAAVADPEEMIVFRCDVLGLPQSTAQALTPGIMERARGGQTFALGVRGESIAYGGLDMGDRCWFFARAHVGVPQGGAKRGSDRPSNVDWMGFPILEGDIRVPVEQDWQYQRALQQGVIGVPQGQLADRDIGDPVGGSRMLAAEGISAGDVVGRAQALFYSLGLSALFIDERPLVNEARSLALALNGLQHLAVWPRIANVNADYISLPGGLTWDGRNARWLNLKCAVVRFTKNRLGAGIEQSVVFFEEGGQTKFVPCIACNRFETIDRVVREFLTPAEGVVEVVNGAVRQMPALLLPPRAAGQPPILDQVDAHHITGSERVKAADGSLGDYVDACENHLLLANGYAKLAEIVGGHQADFSPGRIVALENSRLGRILAAKRNRCCE